jgi:hypothetical protein
VLSGGVSRHMEWRFRVYGNVEFKDERRVISNRWVVGVWGVLVIIDVAECFMDGD